MNLNHVGLNIQKEEELIDFYQNVLDFHFEYQFVMPLELADCVFGVKKQLKAFLYKKEDILLELFVHPVNMIPNLAHICIEMNDRESIAAKCEQSGYPVIRIKRNDKNDLLFIKDKVGNSFELKIGE